MKQMKRTLAALLAFAIAISGITIGVNQAEAENPLTVYGEAVTATAGKEMKIPVMLKNNHGVAGLALKVTYDATIMTPVKAEKGSLISSLSNLQFGDTIATHTGGSFECVAYNDSNFSNNGELLLLTFKVADNAATGSHTLKIELTEYYNEALNDIEATCEDIAIIVGKDNSTGTPNVTAKPGTNANPQATAKPNTTQKPSSGSSSYNNSTPKPKKKKKRKVTKRPARVKIRKIKNIGKGRAKVTWGKVKCNDGYTIQYSTKKNFAFKYLSAAVVSKSKKTCIIEGKSKKTYYVRIVAWNYGYPSKYAEHKIGMRSKKWSKVKKIKLK